MGGHLCSLRPFSVTGGWCGGSIMSIITRKFFEAVLLIISNKQLQLTLKIFFGLLSEFGILLDWTSHHQAHSAPEGA